MNQHERRAEIDPKDFNKLLFDQTRLIHGCLYSGCRTTIYIPGMPLKNVCPTRNPIRLKVASENWLETTHEGKSIF